VCQVKPGQRLRFRQVSVAEAHELLRAYKKELDSAIAYPSP
jgi:allophanate hydrolase subunit 2